MRKQIWIAGVFLLLPLSLRAQTTPKAEMLVGYSFLRIEENNLHGWNVSLAGVVNKNLAIVGDLSGHYSSEKQTFGTATFSSDLRAHSFLLGPRVSETVDGKWTPFAHALFGVSRVSASGDVRTAAGSSSSVEEADAGFAMAAGGGLDLKVSEKMALRLIQADYFLVRTDGFNSEGARISAGIVLRIGSR